MGIVPQKVSWYAYKAMYPNKKDFENPTAAKERLCLSEKCKRFLFS